MNQDFLITRKFQFSAVTSECRNVGRASWPRGRDYILTVSVAMNGDPTGADENETARRVFNDADIEVEGINGGFILAAADPLLALWKRIPWHDREMPLIILPAVSLPNLAALLLEKASVIAKRHNCLCRFVVLNEDGVNEIALYNVPEQPETEE